MCPNRTYMFFLAGTLCFFSTCPALLSAPDLWTPTKTQRTSCIVAAGMSHYHYQFRGAPKICTNHAKMKKLIENEIKSRVYIYMKPIIRASWFFSIEYVISYNSLHMCPIGWAIFLIGWPLAVALCLLQAGGPPSSPASGRGPPSGRRPASGRQTLNA